MSKVTHYAAPMVQCRSHDAWTDIKNLKTTGDERAVGCPECKEWLRQYHAAFPKAHPEKLEGGRR